MFQNQALDSQKREELPQQLWCSEGFQKEQFEKHEALYFITHLLCSIIICLMLNLTFIYDS